MRTRRLIIAIRRGLYELYVQPYVNLYAWGRNLMGPKAVKQPAPPAPAPPPPTIDQAVQNTREDDILRQRKGAAASMLAGTNPSAPQTGAGAKLLGT